MIFFSMLRLRDFSSVTLHLSLKPSHMLLFKPLQGVINGSGCSEGGSPAADLKEPLTEDMLLLNYVSFK